MNLRLISKSLGALLAIVAVCMLPSLIMSMVYSDGCAPAFTLTIVILTAVSLIMNSIKPKSTEIYPRDGFAIVGFGWILSAVFGALPFLISGVIPSVTDALFESVSGFTTTGASILAEVESLPRSIIFWRSFTNWMGGVGVLALMMAILPSVKANSIHIMQAEAPGPYVDKFTPRISWVARILYVIYVGITFSEVIFLLLGGVPLYDAVVFSMSTTSTGGFSSRDLSVGAYNSAYIEIVITVFMLLCGINLSLYQMILRGKIKAALKDSEARFFLSVFVCATVFITINLVARNNTAFPEAIRHAAFQVSTLITSTGFSSMDFNMWPEFSKTILIMVMFMGGCTGSTAGGIKCMRILLIFKILRNELAKILHPNAVHVTRLNGKPVEESVLTGILSFVILYMLVLAASMVVISLDGFSLTTSFTAVLATVSNMGPGLDMVGPMGNYSGFSDLSKIVLTVCMLLGRLEIYPIILLCAPSFWKQSNK
ncbi:MAG: TrkH family potassium uptake protein [Clostridiales bacterium]|jgi:trk system potassium uptake protein TrkH|nr:TrkH family potassium uptake protein [Clostridiales bacterium]